MKLKSKKLIPYKGTVIDLNVAQTHTYNVENLAVHNSGGGSLVNYVLYITDLDPVEWDLPFSRFLSVYRSGAPDIDCVHENHLIIMADHTVKLAKDVKSNDYVLGGDGKPHKITATYSRKLYDNEAIFDIRVRAEDGTLGHLIVVANHKFVKSDGSLAYARNLVCGDSLMATCKVEVVNIERIHNDFQLYSVVDITVEDDHRFHILPFDVVEDESRNLYQHTGCYANN